MAHLKLALGCWNYDRTRALADGAVQADGIEINYLDMPVEETFFRMLRYREFDAAEMSLSSYRGVAAQAATGHSSPSLSFRAGSSGIPVST